MRFLLPLLVVVPLTAQTAHTPRGPAPEAIAWSHYAAQSKLALAALDHATPDTLPPAPDGVTDITFAEFFGPIGDRGLEYSEKLRSLAGQRVRLVGYMVREQGRAPGPFRFAGWPIVVETQGLCTVDDTPPNVAYVLNPGDAKALAAWRPGRLVLTGTLEFGARAESDGRNSFVRLVLDTPESAAPLGAAATSSSTVSTTP